MLQDRINAVEVLLATNTKSESDYAAVVGFNRRLKLIEAWENELNSIIEAVGVFGKSKIRLDSGMKALLADAKRLKKILDRIAERFEKDKSSKSLTKGDDWTRFEEGMNELGADRKTLGCWQAYVRTQYTGDRPEVLTSKIHQSASNKRRLEEYGAKYDVFREEFNKVPENDTDVEKFKTLIKELDTVFKGFDIRPLSQSVKAFLKAVSEDRATLSLLTSEVFEFLNDENELEAYTVRIR